MKHFHIQRLTKLANHLKFGVLGHKKFTFDLGNSVGSRESSFQPPSYTCGTMGCALGECPIVFKRDWWFNENAAPTLKSFIGYSLIWNSMRISAMEYFGITETETEHLFLPGHQYPTFYGGRKLGDAATRKAVARNIFAFLKRKEQDSAQKGK